MGREGREPTSLSRGDTRYGGTMALKKLDAREVQGNCKLPEDSGQAGRVGQGCSRAQQLREPIGWRWGRYF